MTSTKCWELGHQLQWRSGVQTSPPTFPKIKIEWGVFLIAGSLSADKLRPLLKHKISHSFCFSKSPALHRCLCWCACLILQWICNKQERSKASISQGDFLSGPWESGKGCNDPSKAHSVICGHPQGMTHLLQAFTDSYPSWGAAHLTLGYGYSPRGSCCTHSCRFSRRLTLCVNLVKS